MIGPSVLPGSQRVKHLHIAHVFVEIELKGWLQNERIENLLVELVQLRVVESAMWEGHQRCHHFQLLRGSFFCAVPYPTTVHDLLVELQLQFFEHLSYKRFCFLKMRFWVEWYLVEAIAHIQSRTSRNEVIQRNTSGTSERTFLTMVLQWVFLKSFCWDSKETMRSR